MKRQANIWTASFTTPAILPAEAARVGVVGLATSAITDFSALNVLVSRNCRVGTEIPLQHGAHPAHLPDGLTATSVTRHVWRRKGTKVERSGNG